MRAAHLATLISILVGGTACKARQYNEAAPQAVDKASLTGCRATEAAKTGLKAQFACRSKTKSEAVAKAKNSCALSSAGVALNATAGFYREFWLSNSETGVTGCILERQNNGKFTEESWTSLLGEDNKKRWSQIETASASEADGKVTFTLSAHEQMGTGEDNFKITIDKATGKATVENHYMTDCGDGQYHDMKAEFVCSVP